MGNPQLVNMPNMLVKVLVFNCLSSKATLSMTPFEGEPMAVTREPNDMEKALL